MSEINHKELERQIRKTLEKDCDLPEEEYLKKFGKADAAAKFNGAPDETPVDEETRHKRIQSNFFGLCINYLAAILGEVTETNNLLREYMKNGK